MSKNAKRRPAVLPSFGDGLNVAVFGASGGIGAALADRLAVGGAVANVFRLSRTPRDGESIPCDIKDETDIADSVAHLRERVRALHLVIVATGLLHDGGAVQPEKTWASLDGAALEKVFRINTIGPALVAKHVLPLLARRRKSALALLSARVGSISDNRLGGWHGYRASKAALNMMIRNFAIELARRNREALCVGLHPGTVDTPLSKPFQRAVPEDRLFSPGHAARRLLAVLDGLAAEHSGNVYAWDGTRVPA